MLCGMGFKGIAMLISGILFAWLFMGLTESVDITLPPNISVTIEHSAGPASPPCSICTGKDGCKLSKLQIQPGTSVRYNFTCTTPEKHFVMVIRRMIDCNTGVCPFGNVSLQPSSLTGLNRTFLWNVEAPRNIGVELRFNPWIRQINPSHKCKDRITFTVGTLISGSSTSIGTFCKKGTVSRIKLQGGGVVTLQLPWNETLTESGFSIANRSSIKRMCIIESIFETESTTTMMSANYPQGFPNNELMTWQFIIPQNHRASVQFINYTLPNCYMKEQRVEYDLPLSNNNPEVFQFDAIQPGNIGSNFNLSLENCELESQNPKALTLVFNVTVQKATNIANHTYSIDLRKETTMNVRISKPLVKARYFAPVCVICRGENQCSEEIILEGGKYHRISFLCNKLDTLRVTAEQITQCSDFKTCPINNTSLGIPQSLRYLPIPLETITWKILPPPNSSAEIGSRRIKLQQPLLGTTCNATSDFYYHITSFTNGNQFTIGSFCPNGSVEKMQMKGNVTIILNTYKKTNLSLMNHDLYLSFVPSVKEECIFTVSPNSSSTVKHHTPDWEAGLPDYYYLSWNIDLSPKQSAQLTFDRDKIGIMCQMNSALLYIKEKRENGVDIVRKEDEKLPSTLNLRYPFWVNISNCRPKVNYKLQVQFSITVTESNTDIKIIGIVIAAAVCTVIVAVGMTFCCLRKKKKEKQLPPKKEKVNTEMSRRIGFKARKTNESHVYAIIDDTMVYGHLLKDTDGPDNPEVDVYRPFEGAVPLVPPLPRLNGSSKNNPEVDVYRPFEGTVPLVPPLPRLNGSSTEDTWEDPLALSMRQNEIYASSGDLPKVPVEDEDTSLSFLDSNNHETVTSG
ncbi:Hypothetical predicted protein [Pelobates cultripes]|uniref:CUB domain containing protein 1 n=2 Tax=Pelobates cultripes TaxID=61616 RepID=A0AAD1W409_PELCU|nr:Hypothetical predicted protein [Pelobates cultripes]CAH2283198.1 Hypothetical predicted protein [Pelobates cultripes]CAH2283199.1 Hypothetical predicted protein [Pelobates cultripes]